MLSNYFDTNDINFSKDLEIPVEAEIPEFSALYNDYQNLFGTNQGESYVTFESIGTTIQSYEGNDTIWAYRDIDPEIDSGLGNDFLFLKDSKSVQAYGQEGNDTFYLDNINGNISGGDGVDNAIFTNIRLSRYGIGRYILDNDNGKRNSVNTDTVNYFLNDGWLDFDKINYDGEKIYINTNNGQAIIDNTIENIKIGGELYSFDELVSAIPKTAFYKTNNNLLGNGLSETFMSFESQHTFISAGDGDDEVWLYRDEYSSIDNTEGDDTFFIKDSKEIIIRGTDNTDNDTFYMDNTGGIVDAGDGFDTVILGDIRIPEYIKNHDNGPVNNVNTQSMNYFLQNGELDTSKFSYVEDPGSGLKKINIETNNGVLELVNNSVEKIIIDDQEYTYYGLAAKILEKKLQDGYKKNVLFIDDNTEQDDFDGDGTGDLTHYDQTQTFTNDNYAKDVYLGMSSFDELSDLVEMVKASPSIKNKIGAVNVSYSQDMTYDYLNFIIKDWLNNNNLPDITITSENLRENTDLIKEFFSTYFAKVYVEFADNIDKLAAMGIPVVISSGNARENPDKFNVLTLSENAIIAGAGDRQGNLANYSVDNSLVDTVFQGSFAPQIFKEGDEYMIDFNEDNKGDYNINIFSTVKKAIDDGVEINEAFVEELRKKILPEISGTSYAAPNAASYAAYMAQKDIPVSIMNSIFKEAAEKATNFLHTGMEVLRIANSFHRVPPPIDDTE